VTFAGVMSIAGVVVSQELPANRAFAYALHVSKLTTYLFHRPVGFSPRSPSCRAHVGGGRRLHFG
jgi:hypothetical protein